MDNLDYMSLANAAALVSIEVCVLEQRCLSGNIPCAIKRDGTWHVPRSALLKLPEPMHDNILNGIVFASRLDIELPITLLLHGVVLSGYLMAIQTYFSEYRDILYTEMEKLAPGDLSSIYCRRLTDLVLKGKDHIDVPYEELFAAIGDDPALYSFCHLRDVQAHNTQGQIEMSDKIMRIRIASIDAHQYGFNDQRLHVSHK